MAIDILTHRGLDPSRSGYFSESSSEAFADQLGRGYGIEFDAYFLDRGAPKDSIVVAHSIKTESDAQRAPSIADIFALIRNAQHSNFSALHLKSKWQEQPYLDAIADTIHAAGIPNLIIFDLKIETARYIKKRFPKLLLAASVSHPYDILRYNGAVGGTLMGVDEAIENRDLFDWVWLDEWDRKDKDGGKKSLYNSETFARLRELDFKIALVTPELHATSPGLLGGEAHEDAATHDRLMLRVREILLLRPDAVCTDYPDEIRAMIEGAVSH